MSRSERYGFRILFVLMVGLSGCYNGAGNSQDSEVDSETDSETDQTEPGDSGSSADTDSGGETDTASELTFTAFDCSATIERPAQLKHLYDTPSLQYDQLRAIWTMASVYLEEMPAPEACATENPDLSCEEATFTTSNGVAVTYYKSSSSTGNPHENLSAYTRTVITLNNESLDWSALEISKRVDDMSDDISGATDTTYDATWTGTIVSDWPADASAEATFTYAWEDMCTSEDYLWTTDDCALVNFGGMCGQSGLRVNNDSYIDLLESEATIYGECVGQIDSSTWEIIGPCSSP